MFSFTIFEQHLEDIIAGSHGKLEITCYKQGIFTFTHELTNLRNHIIAVHEKRKPHLCPTCGVGFADKSNLINHIAAVHEGKKRPMKNKQFL